MIVSSIASFLMFYVYPPGTDVSACTRYYEGVEKGTVWDRGEWHHYVDFKVDNSAELSRLEVVDAPLPSTLWRKYSDSNTKRVTYRWPSNWLDPFPASDWKICVVSS